MDSKTDSKTDLVVPLQANQDGSVEALRVQQDNTGSVTYSTGNISPIKDGQPINPEDEILTLESADPEGLPIYRVTDSTRGKPSKVNSKAYRDGYDRIFGQKPPVGQC